MSLGPACLPIDGDKHALLHSHKKRAALDTFHCPIECPHAVGSLGRSRQVKD